MEKIGSLEITLPGSYIQGQIQRSVDLVAYSLQASEIADVEKLSIPGIPFQVFPAHNRTMTPSEAEAEFRSWILANALRDCIESLGTAFEWARRFCFIWTSPGEVVPLPNGEFQLQAHVPAEHWNKNNIEQAKKFEWYSFDKKMSFLNEEYGVPIPEFWPLIQGLNAARNCLAHRSGVVGEPDLKNGDDVLGVKWKRVKFIAKGPSVEREVQIPGKVNAGETVGFQFEDVERNFKLRERIEFARDEFVEISFTFLLFAMQLQSCVIEVQKQRCADAFPETNNDDHSQPSGPGK